MIRCKYTETDYISECEKRDLQYVGYIKKPRGRTIVRFICNKHRGKGEQESEFYHLRTYTYGCRFCSGRGKTTEEMRREVDNEDIIILSEYAGNEKPITCQCKQCGNVWTTLPKVLITNKSGCPACGIRKRAEKKRKSQDEFEKQLRAIQPSIMVIGKYIGTHEKVRCRCLIDGAEWDAIPANLLNNSAGCPTCSMSVGEKALLNELDTLGVKYETQYPIDAGFKRKLRFDAYDPVNKVDFEYNGEQHYMPINFSGAGDKEAKAAFELTKKRDYAKRQFCDTHGIRMIVVPYWERKNIGEFLQSEIKNKGLNRILSNKD